MTLCTAKGAALLLLLLANRALASQVSGNFGPDYATYATALKAQLLAGYDKTVPPKSNRATLYSSAGTDVSLGLNVYKVTAVDASAGRMTLKVWLRMSWIDTRLAWDPADHDGITWVHVWTDTRPTSWNSEVWLPDIQPYNSYASIQDTLDPGPATLSSDGSIFFSRPGQLELQCKFSGLVSFPFDNLKCNAEFGGWLYGGGHQGIQLLGDGYSFGQEATSGSSYQEYTISNITATTRLYEYDCCPSDPYPVVMYTFTLHRASMFYALAIVLPTMVVTILSFAVFFAPTASADALGYGITVIVVVFLMQIVLMDVLPICGEVLWIDTFIIINILFCMLALLQSCFTIVIENVDTEHLVPTWVVLLWRKLEAPLLLRIAPAYHARYVTRRAKQADKEGHESVAGVVFRNLLAGQHGDEAERIAQRRRGDSESVIASIANVANADDAAQSPLKEGMAPPSPTMGGHTPSVRPSCRGLQGGSLGLRDEDAYRLVFFESLFFKLDADMTGTIDVEECFSLFSFAALDMPVAERRVAFETADTVRDGSLSRLEFLQLCAEEIWNVPVAQIELAMENMSATKSALQRKHLAYWGKVADSIDGWARLMIPLAYAAAMLFLFNVDLRDRYEEDPSFEMGPQAVYIRSVETVGVVWLVLICGGVSVLLLAFCLMTDINRRERKRTRKERLERSINTNEQKLNQEAQVVKRALSRHHKSRKSAFIEELDVGTLSPPLKAEVAQVSLTV